MKTTKVNQQRITALCFLASVLCGCDQSVEVAEHPNYQSAADRYNVPDSNYNSDAAGDQRPLATFTDVAATDARGSTSPLAAPGSMAPPNTVADPLTQQRIADLESMVEDLRSQLNQSREGDFNEASPEVDETGFDAGSAYRHRYVRSELDRLIRIYKRARTEVAQSDVSYKVDHMMTLFKSFELLLHDTPQTFNPLPERDRYVFRNFQEAAEDLVPALKDYLDEFGSETNNEFAEFETLLREARAVIEMQPPGTGNRMLDFIQELETNLENQQRRNNE